MSKTDFDNKTMRFNKQIKANKANEVPKKPNSLTAKDYNFFFGRIYITSNDGSQNTFVYQPTLDTLESKIDSGTYYIFGWKSRGVYSTNLKPLYTAFLYSINLS